MNPDEATSLKQLFLSILPKDGGIVVGTVTKESPLTIQILAVWGGASALHTVPARREPLKGAANEPRGEARTAFDGHR